MKPTEARPVVGPGFVSTGFRVNLFKQEATEAWEHFKACLDGIPAREDLEAASLRLPSVEEEVAASRGISLLSRPFLLASPSQPAQATPVQQAGSVEQPNGLQQQRRGVSLSASDTEGPSGQGALPRGPAEADGDAQQAAAQSMETEAEKSDYNEEQAVRGRGRGRGRGRLQGQGRGSSQGRKRGAKTASQTAVGSSTPDDGKAVGAQLGENDTSQDRGSSLERRRERGQEAAAAVEGDGSRLPEVGAPEAAHEEAEGQQPAPEAQEAASAQENGNRPHRSATPHAQAAAGSSQHGGKRAGSSDAAQSPVSSERAQVKKLKKGDNNTDYPEIPEDLLQKVSTKDGLFKKTDFGRYRVKEAPKRPGTREDILDKRMKAMETNGKHLKSVQEALSRTSATRLPEESLFSRVHNRTIHTNTVPAPAAQLQDGINGVRDRGSVPQNEVILWISIRQPDLLHVHMQDFLVLGSQRLSELRDIVQCPSDDNMKAINMAVPGAFFFIEGAFYTDGRYPQSADYVTPIVKFCQQEGIMCPPEIPMAAEALPVDENVEDTPEGEEARKKRRYKQGDMAQTTWQELGLRAGPAASYVYCHQGCCEHLLVIEDVRLLHPDDPQESASYPLCTSQVHTRRRSCDICNNCLANCVTYDDLHASHTPAFWCQTCYRMMHYKHDGTLLYPHKVFPYNSG